MHRGFVFFLVIAVGCSTSTPHGSSGQNATPGHDGPPSEKAPRHDYSQWKLYAPKEATFKVRFPSDPTLRTTPHGSETIHVAGVQRQGVDGLGYVCQWLLKEKPSASREAEAAYLKGQQEGALKSSNGKLVEEKEITLGGVPGREFIIAVADRNVLHCRVYLAGTQVINLQVWGRDKEAVSSGEAIKFLDSLALGK
jgi:hypothetical protein